MGKKAITVLSGLAFAIVIIAATVFFRSSGPPLVGQVYFGAILDLTGVGASYGKRMRQGYELALADAKTRSVGAANMELLVEDFQWDTGKALAAYRKLTSVDGVKVLVGITGSKHAKPVAEASKTNDVIIIDALTSSPSLTRHGGKNYFRVMPSDAFAGKYNAEWAAASGTPNRNAAIVYVEDEWGVSYAQELRGYLKKSEISVLSVGVIAGARDFNAQVTRLKNAGVGSVFILLYPGDAAVFMQQAKQQALEAVFYGSDNLSAPEFTIVGNDIVDGVRLALPASTTGATYAGFAERYQKAYGKIPDAVVAKAYDAMAVAVEAVLRVGNNPSRIREYLLSQDYGYEGLTGRTEFDNNGDLKSQKYAKFVYRNGKLIPFTE